MTNVVAFCQHIQQSVIGMGAAAWQCGGQQHHGVCGTGLLTKKFRPSNLEPLQGHQIALHALLHFTGSLQLSFQSGLICLSL